MKGEENQESQDQGQEQKSSSSESALFGSLSSAMFAEQKILLPSAVLVTEYKLQRNVFRIALLGDPEQTLQFRDNLENLGPVRARRKEHAADLIWHRLNGVNFEIWDFGYMRYALPHPDESPRAAVNAFLIFTDAEDALTEAQEHYDFTNQSKKYSITYATNTTPPSVSLTDKQSDDAYASIQVSAKMARMLSNQLLAFLVSAPKASLYTSPSPGKK